MNPRLQQQQQALMQQALLQQQQQQQLYHQGILAAAMTQMEPVPSGNLPPGFDPSSCRSVYVGNIHPNVTESLLAEVFQSVGSLEGCKLIRKEKSYGFVDYHDRRSAAMAIATLHGRQLYGQSIKVNWAFPSVQREDTSGHYHIFVGDLCPTITDADLYNCFQEYTSLSDARVMWDNKTGRSKLYGFVSFRGQQDAQSAINEMTGKWLGSRQIRCNWATKSNIEEKQNNENQDSVVLTNGSADGTQESSKEEAPENNPAYTTVYVGNLAHEVTQSELHLQFHILGAGIIEEVRVQSGKGFGFVRYQTHEQAALAIQRANGRIVCGKSMKCSWGSKPTPPGTASNPLPPPVMPFMSQTGYSVAELLAYQRQLALNQVTAGSITGQQALAAQASALISGGNHAIYESYPGNPSSQQMLYYN